MLGVLAGGQRLDSPQTAFGQPRARAKSAPGQPESEPVRGVSRRSGSSQGPAALDCAEIGCHGQTMFAVRSAPRLHFALRALQRGGDLHFSASQFARFEHESALFHPRIRIFGLNRHSIGTLLHVLALAGEQRKYGGQLSCAWPQSIRPLSLLCPTRIRIVTDDHRHSVLELFGPRPAEYPDFVR